MTRHIIIASTIVVCIAGTSWAGQLVAKKPSETVVLIPSPTDGPCGVEQIATQVPPDSSEVPFTLGAGKALMVTDITWVLEDATAGDTVGLEFYAANGDVTALMTVDGEANARGIARGHAHFATPVRVNDVLCANPVLIEGTTVPTVHDMRVMGFITQDR